MTVRAPFPDVRLKHLTDRDTARIRLYGVPPSGTGSEYFLPWVAALPELFDLTAAELPGRGARIGEPSITDVGWAADSIAEAIAADLRRRPLADGCYALFGHSFGALLAFEATHRLRSTVGSGPDLLALSAVPPPNRGGLGDHIARGLVSGASAITELMGWEQPTDDAVARAVFTPFLADAVAQLQHTPQARPPLSTRLSVFGGLDDPIVDPDALDEWSAHAVAGARVHRYPGDHQYLRHRLAEVLAQLTEDLLAAYRGTSDAGAEGWH
jgi:surfactin synthase thioesterase subunit